jgi:hypothetical protein
MKSMIQQAKGKCTKLYRARVYQIASKPSSYERFVVAILCTHL